MTSNIYGYRTSLGTQDAVMNVREKIIESIALEKKVALISWDIRGAFNEIPHSLIVAALKNSGASEGVARVVESYLSAQEQHVEVDGKKSCSWKNAGRGVAQGSHLAGPAYNIATLGHTDPSRLNTSSRYSDDDTEICIGSNPAELQKEILRALTDKKTKSPELG